MNMYNIKNTSKKSYLSESLRLVHTNISILESPYIFFLFYLDVIQFCYTTNMNATEVAIITSTFIKLDKKSGWMVLNFWPSPKYLKMSHTISNSSPCGSQ